MLIEGAELPISWERRRPTSLPVLAVTRGDRRLLLLDNDGGRYVDGRVVDLSTTDAPALAWAAWRWCQRRLCRP